VHSSSSHFALTSILMLAISSAAAAGCGASVDSVTTGNGTASGPTGLPCEVAALLSDQCISCHSNPPVGGAPSALVTRDDLLSPSKTMPGKTRGEAALLRMQSTTAPMPPTGAPPAADVAAFETWLSAGMPEGTCTNPTGEPVCTSGVSWPPGADGDPMMNPGQTCVTCHQNDPEAEAPLLLFGGTVYTTKHEPNDCLGGSTNTSDNLWVEITDASGTVINVPVNEAGNFYRYTAIGTLALPYTAKVYKNGLARAMATPQTSGDCNGCHTQDGANGAPGRIMMP